jgi:hypothetical protein
MRQHTSIRGRLKRLLGRPVPESVTLQHVERPNPRSRDAVDLDPVRTVERMEQAIYEACEIPDLPYRDEYLVRTAPPAEILPGVVVRMVKTNGIKTKIEPA